MSNLENKVSLLLSNAHIKFIVEKQFKDLRNGLYRFDFYLPNQNCLIEVQGAQHYSYTKAFFKKKDEFLKAQERDRRKISYCLARNIQLYCIPYWDIDNLKSAQDLFKEKYIAKNKFHNDEVWREYKKKTQI